MHNFYSMNASEEGQWSFASWYQLMKMAPILQILREHPEYYSILDVGCGKVEVKNFIAQTMNRSVDFCGFDANSDVHPDIVGDAQEMPFEDSHFDLVTMLDSIQNIDPLSRDQVYKEVDRIMKPGGTIYLFFRTLNFLPRYESSHRYIAGEDSAFVCLAFPNYEIKSFWGFDDGEHTEFKHKQFPDEFNQMFGHLGSDPFTCKFNGVILEKGT
jgi:ubiquinone/menaquinone biosynthesis C-methylase UbiE